MKNCPFCAEEIQDAAIVCRFCNADLVKHERPSPSVVIIPAARTWSPGVAAVLSLVIPGAGQMYKGHVGQGIAWLFGVVIAYALFLPLGLIPHIICIIVAASGSPNPQASEAARLEQESARAAEFQAAKAEFLKAEAERKPFSTREKLIGLGLVVAAVGIGLWAAGVSTTERSNARTTTTATTTPSFGLPIAVKVSRSGLDFQIDNTTPVEWEACRAELAGSELVIPKVERYGRMLLRRADFSPPISDAEPSTFVVIRCQKQNPS